MWIFSALSEGNLIKLSACLLMMQDTLSIHCLLNIFGFKLIVFLSICVISTYVISTCYKGEVVEDGGCSKKVG